MADEPPTPHSARFWNGVNYSDHMFDPKNVVLKQISKQFFRDLVVSKGFKPKEEVSDSNPIPLITTEEELQAYEIYLYLMYKFRSVIEKPAIAMNEIDPSDFVGDAYLNNILRKTNAFLKQISS